MKEVEKKCRTIQHAKDLLVKSVNIWVWEKKQLAVLHVLGLSQVMRVLPRNPCSHSRREVGSVCMASSTRLCQPEVHSVSVHLGEHREKWHVCVWQGYITPLRADGHVKTPEDSHPSSTMGAMGDIRASICLNDGKSLFPPCLCILFNTGCFKYSLFQEETPTSYTATGLIKQRVW